MRGLRSWTSSIVGFSLAVLLVAWSLQQAVAVLRDVWPVLALVALAVIGLLVGIGIFRRRNYW